ncbi:MAG: VTT domain-containing protein [Deltaproteobacteria bacterium]|nr:VTT domain-containing protein [Deltaproteobacteria bacterium]
MTQLQSKNPPGVVPAELSLAETTISALKSPRTQKLLAQTLLGLGALLAVVGLIAWAAREPLTHASLRLVEAHGVLGLVLGVILADACPIPVPSAPFLLVAYVGGLSFAKVWIAGGLASVAAGPLCYLLGRTLGRSDRIHAWMSRTGITPMMARHGSKLVFVAAISPLPYAATAWIAGATRIPFWPFLGACFGRLLKIGVYLSVVVFGWTL